MSIVYVEQVLKLFLFRFQAKGTDKTHLVDKTPWLSREIEDEAEEGRKLHKLTKKKYVLG